VNIGENQREPQEKNKEKQRDEESNPKVATEKTIIDVQHQ
jgi:hypothetical protein